MKHRPTHKTIRNMCLWIFIVSTVTLVLWILYTVGAIQSKEYNDAQYKQYDSLCDDFIAAADLFSDEAREYTIDFDINRMNTYWTEASDAKTIENCIAEAQKGDFTQAELSSLINAAQTIELLRSTEAQAMLLVTDGCNYDEGVIPKELSEYNLTFAQRNLDDEDKLYSARLLLYGEKYTNAHDSIRVDVETFRKVVELRYDEYNSDYTQMWNISATVQIAGLSIIFVTSASMLIVYRFFTDNPGNDKTNEKNKKGEKRDDK